MTNKFTKAPLSKAEKEKKAEDFLNFSNEKDSGHLQEQQKTTIGRILTKEATKRITMRLPISLADDITEISALTGLSINSVSLELLRASAKQKLKDLKS